MSLIVLRNTQIANFELGHRLKIAGAGVPLLEAAAPCCRPQRCMPLPPPMRPTKPAVPPCVPSPLPADATMIKLRGSAKEREDTITRYAAEVAAARKELQAAKDDLNTVRALAAGRPRPPLSTHTARALGAWLACGGVGARARSARAAAAGDLAAAPAPAAAQLASERTGMKQRLEDLSASDQACSGQLSTARARLGEAEAKVGGAGTLAAAPLGCRAAEYRAA